MLQTCKQIGSNSVQINRLCVLSKVEATDLPSHTFLLLNISMSLSPSSCCSGQGHLIIQKSYGLLCFIAHIWPDIFVLCCFIKEGIFFSALYINVVNLMSDCAGYSSVKYLYCQTKKVFWSRIGSKKKIYFNNANWI